ncbi:reverse transcriptase domain-containing protein [Nonlabens antarcticus]|uniref:reverse transcriptase domain-containing protein n=1 Tax=Nonlabens antarcticus TaxID=392714 RepID=UPI0018918BFC|nr:reverse transcriptase domain-containing protein [Nonlabens antarcticus]
MNIKKFEYYFSERVLLKILCRKRILLAKKEHDKLFHKKILLKKGHDNLDELYQIFPSRNKWLRLNKNERRGKSALEINVIQLERTVLRATEKFKKKPIEKWHQNLIEMLLALRSNILNHKYEVPKPLVLKQFKEIKSKKTIYRPIAYFEYLDRIIIGQVNKYLTDCFDPLFLDCSYAFRSIKKGGKPFTHHLAVEDIINFKKEHHNEDLYVAECDIKKFYDCVNHNKAKEIFKINIKKCNSQGIEIDNRAKNLFYSYLECYSFNEDVLAARLPKNSEFGWVKTSDLLKVGSDSTNESIGVPQGGAISCLIANLLMHEVDEKVMKFIDKKNTFYARFCDDMVLLSNSKGDCKSILEVYSNTLKDMKLLSHPFSEFKVYSKEFWKSKSKAPYKWAKNDFAKNVKNNVPWLSFVGYQVNSDLKIRVRRSSLKKEINKQFRETGKVISLINGGFDFRISERAIKYRVTQRLLSMSVGRRNVFYRDQSIQMCWTSGFKLLRESDNIVFQPKHLDRKRAKNLARLDSKLRKMDKANRPDRNRKKADIDKEPKYYGHPFSYFSQLK